MSTVPAQGGQSSPQTAAPEKTPEQIKIEALMSQWPECVRNPKKYENDLIELKNQLELFYKNYNPDKVMLYDWETLPEIDIVVGLPEIGALTTQTYQHLLQKFKGFLNTAFIFERFNFIADIKDTDRDTYKIIIPILKSYMAKFDRSSINELYYASIAAAKINLADNEYWGILEQKLTNEKLYRYLSLEQCVNMALELNKAEKGSELLLKGIEINIIKHRKALHLNKSLLKKAIKAYEKPKIGSDILKAALKDAEIEVPGIDYEIISMNKKKEHEKQLYEKKLLH